MNNKRYIFPALFLLLLPQMVYAITIEEEMDRVLAEIECLKGESARLASISQPVVSQPFTTPIPQTAPSIASVSSDNREYAPVRLADNKSAAPEETYKNYLADKKRDSSPVENEFYKEQPMREKKEGSFFVSFGHNANHMHYKEFLPGTHDVPDENYGKLTGLYGGGGFYSARPVSYLGNAKPFLEGYFRRYDAEITYDGSWSDGSGPVSFKQRMEIQRYGLKLGGVHDISSKLKNNFYLDIGTRIWYRGENDGTGGYAEKYYWLYMGLGIGVNYQVFNKLTCGAEVEFMGSLDQKMRADSGVGRTYRLGDVVGWEVKVPIKYNFTNNFSLDVTPYFTWWTIGRSEPIDIGGGWVSYEPDSHTHIEGLLVGFTLRN